MGLVSVSVTPSAFALSVPPVPSTPKVTAYLETGVPPPPPELPLPESPALFGQAVNSSAMSSAKAAPKKANALCCVLFVFICFLLERFKIQLL